MPDKSHLSKIVESFSTKRVAVVGDLMLDRYFWSKVKRISPEAPVPVALVERETYQLGGAANVANNLLELGAKPTVFGVIGQDAGAEQLCQIFAEKSLNTAGLVKTKERATTLKTRIIAEGQHILRVDREDSQQISSSVQEEIITKLKSEIHNLDALIFEDYNKGLLSSELIEHIIALCHQHGVFVAVDPKFENFLAYKNVDLFKPNRGEAQRVLGYPVRSPEEIDKAAKELLIRLECKTLLLTLSEQGMCLYNQNGEKSSVPAVLREIHDPSGAGDTVISTYTLAAISGASPEQAMQLANYAASVVCGKSGAQPIHLAELKEVLADK